MGYAAALVVTRGYPSRDWDGGIFVSVAGRLLDGDTLYVDVIDNKDPLFYYSHAAALAVAGWRGPFALDIVWLALAALGSFLLLRAVGAILPTAIAAFIAYPMLLTCGLWYYAGYSMLAALSLVPLIGWLWMDRRFMLAGALVGIGLLFKINLAPVLVSPLVTLAALRLPQAAIWPSIRRAGSGFAVTVGLAAVILAMQGALGGYLEGLRDNVGYASEVLAVRGAPTGPLEHLKVVWDALPAPFPALFGAALLLGVGVAAWSLLGRRDANDRETRATMAVAALFASAVIATGFTLALTAAWDHHTQMLAYPALMLLTLLVAIARAGHASLARGTAAVACALVAVSVLVYSNSRPANPHADGWSPSAWLEGGPPSPYAEHLERTADVEFPGLRDVGFAHLGVNDEDGFAAFLDDRFRLVCPRIAQYVFTPDLHETSHCIETREPYLVLVTKFTPVTGVPEWNRFVSRSMALLKQRYEPVAGPPTAPEVYALRAQ